MDGGQGQGLPFFLRGHPLLVGRVQGQFVEKEAQVVPLPGHAQKFPQIALPVRPVVGVQVAQPGQIKFGHGLGLAGQVLAFRGYARQKLGQGGQGLLEPAAQGGGSQAQEPFPPSAQPGRGLVGALEAHPFHQDQHPAQGQAVGRVGRQAQKGQKILDVGRFQEFAAAVFGVGEAAAHQFHFQVEGMARSPEEHGDVPKGQALGHKFLDAGGHGGGFVGQVPHGLEFRGRAGPAHGHQGLVVAFPGPGDEVIGQGHDGLPAAVVFFQLHDPGPGEDLGEVHDVSEAGPPEGVDGLGLVAHGGDPLVVPAQKVGQAGLDRVGVLVFVHQDVIVAAGQAAADIFVFPEHGFQARQEVVEIHQGVFELLVPVFQGDFFQQGGVFLEVGEVFGHDLGQGPVLVDRLAQEAEQGPFLREALVFFYFGQIAADAGQKGFGVVLVHDGEAVRVAQKMGRGPEKGVGQGVKGAPGDLAGPVSGQGHGPVQHFPGRLAGEGQQENGRRRDPLAHQVGHPVDQGAGFAAAGPGHDEQGAAFIGGRGQLGSVEPGGQVRRFGRLGFERFGRFGRLVFE